MKNFNTSNFHIVYYEDLLQNFEATVLKLANFINIGDINIETDVVNEMENLKRVTNVGNMQKLLNAKVPIKNFVRKGVVGDSQNYFNEEMAMNLKNDLKGRLDKDFFDS